MACAWAVRLYLNVEPACDIHFQVAVKRILHALFAPYPSNYDVFLDNPSTIAGDAYESEEELCRAREVQVDQE